jgi:hypothetical protein
MASHPDAPPGLRRRRGVTWPTLAAGVVALLVLGTALAGGGRERPAASPDALARIAERNQDAAIAAAARMKAESEASARATDARLDAADNAAAR